MWPRSSTRTRNAQGQTYYYTQDGLGSVRSLTNASGSAVNKNDDTNEGNTGKQGPTIRQENIARGALRKQGTKVKDRSDEYDGK